MRSTFVDAQLDAALDRDGYVVVPFLSDDEVSDLRDHFDRLGPAPGDGRQACHSSFHSFDRDYKLAVDREVRRVFTPHLDRLFDRQRALPCNFLVKWPGANSGFGLHQDVALCDELSFRSVEVWVALEDIDETNGQLWMVPGSADWLPGYTRGINANEFPFRDVAKRIIARHSRPVSVKAGQAVVFRHATLHFSLPNRSGSPRLVAITDLIPEEALHLGYFGDGDGGIEEYALEADFWTDNSPFDLRQPDESARRRSLAVDARRLTDDDLDRLVAEGRAIDNELFPGGAINSARSWCHRCGATGFDANPLDRLIGNVTLLCPECDRFERLRSGSGVDALRAQMFAELADSGHSTIPLLDAPTRQHLRALLSTVELPVDGSFLTTANDLDSAEARRVDLEVQRVLAPRIEQIFGDVGLAYGGFLIKRGGHSAAVSFHQDLTYVDERHARAFVVWAPLSDQGNTGELLVVPHSHTWSTGIRAGGPPTDVLGEFTDALRAHAVDIPLGAGEAAVWDAALIHGTNSHDHAEDRLVVGVVVAPQGAELVHFQRDESSGDLRGYVVDDAFFTEQSIRCEPVGYAPRSAWTEAVAASDFAAALKRLATPVGGTDGVADVPDGPSAEAAPMSPSDGLTDDFPTSTATSRRVLADPLLDRQLADNGFTTTPVMSWSEAAGLRSLYFDLRPRHGEGFRSDLEVDDAEYRSIVREALSDLLDERLRALFDGFEPFMYSFLCKYPGDDSELYLHRDWMYVDERTGARTFAVWIALEDITSHNGQLRVLRGSHRIDSMLRGTNLIAPWLQHEAVIRERLVTVPAPTGQAIIFDNSLAHCSYPNYSDQPRVAIAIAMKPVGEPLVHFRRSGPFTADRYDVDERFFETITASGLMAAPPTDLAAAESVTVQAAALTADQLVERLNRVPGSRVDALRSTAIGLADAARSNASAAVASGTAQVARTSRRAAAATKRTATNLADRAREKRASFAPRRTPRQWLDELTDSVPTKVAMTVLAINEAVINRFGPEAPAVWDVDQFEWSARVEAAWPAVRREVDALLASDRQIPDIEDVTGGIPQGNVGPWKSFVLMHHGDWMEWNCERCPETTALVRSIPGLTMAGFSVLEPGTYITEHRGPNKGALRYQLGVKVPGREGDCRIRVGDEMIHWRDGEGVAFDFTVPHEAWNDTEEIRVLLMLEFLTPLPAYLAIPNSFAQHAMGWFPTTRAMKRRLKALEPSLAREQVPA